MMRMISLKRKTFFLLAFTLLQAGPWCHGQANRYDKADKELAQIYARIFPFYYSNHDSLNYYSDLFSTRLGSFIKSNPGTLDYKFKSLTDSNACKVVTTIDGQFRIYSWNTWLGGTMYAYKNLYQFKSEGKVYATEFDYGEGDMGTCFTGLYPLKANGNTYFLAISVGNESSRYYYEMISVYSIAGNKLNDKIRLFKTSSGYSNSIQIEYDVSSVMKRPERPIRLIKYDAAQKIVYIPIVLKDGTVTDRFILYQFKGQYFEKIKT